MANNINLDPALGKELVDSVSNLCNGVLNTYAKQAYGDSQLLGDNAVTSQFEDKFQEFQKQYNDSIFPALERVQQTFKDHTNYAELQEQMKISTDVDRSTAGMAQAEALGSAQAQISSLTDLIS